MPAPNKVEGGSAEIWRLVQRVVNSKRSHNQVLSSLISLEKRITPEERLILVDGVASVFRELNLRRRMELRLFDYFTEKEKFDLLRFRMFERCQRLAALRHWASQLSGHASLAGNEFPQNYRRVWSRGGKILFRKGPGQGSAILVCFTDGTGRIMMSIADFLQAWQGADRDVLVLWPRRGGKFEAGISGCGEDLRSGILGLGRLLKSLDYRTVYVLGTSSGAKPALLYGLLHNPNQVLLAGPSAKTLEQVAKKKANALVDPVSGKKLSSNRVSVVFGEGSKVDTQVAQQFSEYWNCQIFAVPESDHICLYTLLERSQFPSFLVSVFEDSA